MGVTGSAAPDAALIEWGVATFALEGGHCGDGHLVAPFLDGVLVAVIDGLGHGWEAAEATRAAIAVLQADPAAPLVELVRRCHEALRRTRGAVMSLVALQGGELSWTGIGNVEALLLRPGGIDDPQREAVVPRGGIVGYQIPSVRSSAVPVARGDTLVMATDGIRSGFAQRLPLHEPPQDLAESILASHGRGSDDALVLVARYLGAA